MAAITTRQTTSAVAGITNNNGPLSNTQLDTNFINIASDLNNAVYLTGSQTISGAKTFTNNVNVQGSAGGALLLAYNTTSSSSIGLTVRPRQNFTSFSGTKTISATMLDSGTLSFDGSVGQLFNITDSMSGTIFSVNDTSGIPSIEVLDTGLVKIAQYNGNVVVGSGTDNGIHKVQITGTQLISANSTTDALRITQTGTGNAIVVEDEANPDSTPFVVSTEGRVGIGVNGTSIPGIAGLYITSDDGNRRILHQRMTTDTSGPAFIFSKGRGTLAATTAVSSGDTLGELQFSGYGDATNRYAAANITAAVDATPGTNDMPGRLVFSTTQDGTTTPTEALRINSSQNVGIGNGVTSTDSAFTVSKAITTGTTAYGIRNYTTVSSNITSAYLSFSSHAYTTAASFTLNNYTHYEAQQITIGAGSTVTNQVGFNAGSGLIGATNNYGFYGNIPSGTGRWNFYAAGTADNYFAGPIKLGQTYYSNIGIGIFYAPASVAATGIYQDPTINSATTSSYTLNSTFPTTAAASFTLGTLTHYNANQGTLGAGSTITNQYGFSAGGGLTGATNNYGFYGNIPSGTNRWNFYANTTAWNYFAGRLGVGSTSLTDTSLRIGQNISGAAGAYGVLLFTDVLSDVTSVAYGFRSSVGTQATAFTLANLNHFNATQGTLGAGSAVTNQYGFNVTNTLIGATNNYGFYGDIAGGTGRWNFYANGTASNYFAGNVYIGTTGNDYARTWRFVVRQDQNAVSNFGFINTTAGTNAAVQISKITGTGNSYLDWALVDNNGTPYDAFNYGSAVTHVSWTLGASERLRVNSTGTVSIAGAPPTTSITSKLYIASDITLAGANRSILGNLYFDTAWKYTGNGYGWGWRDDSAGKIQFIRAANNTGGANAAATVTLSDLETYDLVNNRIGIGTSSPGAKLEVYGDTILGGTVGANRKLTIDGNGIATFRYDDNSLTNAIQLDNLASAITNHGLGVVWRFGTDVSTTAIQSGAIRVAKEQTWTSTATTQDSYMSFSTTLDGTLGERVRITSSGSVGIGATPTSLLHIQSSSDVALQIRGSAASDQTIQFGRSDQNSTWIVGRDNTDSTFRIQYAASSSVGTLSDSAYFLIDDATGNVGIGTVAPGYKLEVNGSFAATTKSFVIDHPTKPSMKLRYGSLEGPENGVYVRGRIKDVNTIELPEYWTKLVDPATITVNLTPVGSHQNLYVYNIENNVVTVKNSNMLNKSIDCFYTVFAERCDVEKLQVEV
jgi:hypothetical protein